MAASAALWAFRQDAFRRLAVSSPEQLRRLNRVFSEQFFLLSTDTTPPEGDDMALARFLVSSSSGSSSYEVVLRRSGFFHCSCPDARGHCVRHMCVCKHVCFLLVRVLRRLDVGFFDGAPRFRLSSDAIEDVQRKCRDIASHAEAGAIASRVSGDCAAAPRGHATDLLFGAPRREPEAGVDECPVCYEALVSLGGDEAHPRGALVGCPACGNGVHAACMVRWLAHAPVPSCVYCRDTVWRSWRPRA